MLCIHWKKEENLEKFNKFLLDYYLVTWRSLLTSLSLTLLSCLKYNHFMVDISSTSYSIAVMNSSSLTALHPWGGETIKEYRLLAYLLPFRTTLPSLRKHQSIICPVWGKGFLSWVSHSLHNLTLCHSDNIILYYKTIVLHDKAIIWYSKTISNRRTVHHSVNTS